jgi:preprotein translocase subunit YajC
LTDYGTSLLATGSRLLLAQGEAGPTNPLGSMLTLVLPLVVLYYFLILRPQRTTEKAHKTLLQNLKKNDRVVTIGGIYGVVVNVQREDDEVTIKVDEGTNTKLRITFNAIARVIGDDEPGDKTSKS